MGQDQSLSKDGKITPNDPRARLKPPINQIVVVSGKTEDKTDDIHNDEDIQVLRKAKLSKPILRNLFTNEPDIERLPRIVSTPMTEMILRYQFHLTECSEAVAFDQNALTKQMKETDALAQRVCKSMNEKYKSTEKAITQIESVHDVSLVLTQIERNLNSCIELFKAINKKLPMEDQIHDPEFR